jgi:hypothetical protein
LGDQFRIIKSLGSSAFNPVTDKIPASSKCGRINDHLAIFATIKKLGVRESFNLIHHVFPDKVSDRWRKDRAISDHIS